MRSLSKKGNGVTLDEVARRKAVVIEILSSWKNLHKNVYVTDRRVELLGCMYDDGVVVAVAHWV